MPRSIGLQTLAASGPETVALGADHISHETGLADWTVQDILLIHPSALLPSRLGNEKMPRVSTGNNGAKLREVAGWRM